MNLSQFKPFKQYSFLRRFDLQPNIRERNPVVKRDPTTVLNQLYRNRALYTYNEQTNAHVTDAILYSSLFIAPTHFDANTASSASSRSVPAKLHKRVHAAFMAFFKRNFHIHFLES